MNVCVVSSAILAAVFSVWLGLFGYAYHWDTQVLLFESINLVGTGVTRIVYGITANQLGNDGGRNYALCSPEYGKGNPISCNLRWNSWLIRRVFKDPSTSVLNRNQMTWNNDNKAELKMWRDIGMADLDLLPGLIAANLPKIRIETNIWISGRKCALLWKSGVHNESLIKQIIESSPSLESTQEAWRELGARGMIVHAHGGGYVAGVPVHHQYPIGVMVDELELPSLMIHYTLAPETIDESNNVRQFVDDSVKIIDFLRERGVLLSKQVWIGDSAGGGLVLGLAQRYRQLYLSDPQSFKGDSLAMIVAISPWTDLCYEFDDLLAEKPTIMSYIENDQRDIMINLDTLRWAAEMVLIGMNKSEECQKFSQSGQIEAAKKCRRDTGMDELCKDPELSPFYGQLSDVRKKKSDIFGRTKIYVFYAECEVLRDDSVLMFDKVMDSEKDTLRRSELCVHDLPLIYSLKESQLELFEIINWVKDGFKQPY